MIECVLHCMIDYMESFLQSSFRINLVWLTIKVDIVPSSHFLVVVLYGALSHLLTTYRREEMCALVSSTMTCSMT